MTKPHVNEGWLLKAALVLSLLALVASLLTYSSIRGQNDERIQLGQSNNDILRRVNRLTAQINDCLTPSGTCAKASRQSSRSFGAAITFCVLSLPDTATKGEVKDCIVDTLNAEARAESPPSNN